MATSDGDPKEGRPTVHAVLNRLLRPRGCADGPGYRPRTCRAATDRHRRPPATKIGSPRRSGRPRQHQSSQQIRLGEGAQESPVLDPDTTRQQHRDRQPQRPGQFLVRQRRRAGKRPGGGEGRGDHEDEFGKPHHQREGAELEGASGEVPDAGKRQAQPVGSLGQRGNAPCPPQDQLPGQGDSQGHGEAHRLDAGPLAGGAGRPCWSAWQHGNGRSVPGSQQRPTGRQGQAAGPGSTRGSIRPGSRRLQPAAAAGGRGRGCRPAAAPPPPGQPDRGRERARTPGRRQRPAPTGRGGCADTPTPHPATPALPPRQGSSPPAPTRSPLTHRGRSRSSPAGTRCAADGRPAHPR